MNLHKSIQYRGTLLGAIIILLIGCVPAYAASPVLHTKGNTWSLIMDVNPPGTDDIAVCVTWQGNPGDFLRQNPDGTYWIHLQSNDATIELRSRNSESEDRLTWELIAEGTGSINSKQSSFVEFNDGGFRYQGDGTYINVQVRGRLQTVENAGQDYPFDFTFFMKNFFEKLQVRCTFDPIDYLNYNVHSLEDALE